MLKKLVFGTMVALAGLTMVAGPVVAQPPPPWGWGAPGFGIYIGPPVRRYPPPPVYRRFPPPPPQAYYCNYRACAATYRSFDPRSCTYQPYYGPRQYCNIR